MAYAVLAAVEAPGRATGVAGGRFVRPWADDGAVAVPVAERPPLRSLRLPA